MSDLSPHASIQVWCPYCGFRMEKEIKYLKKNATFSCPKCKGVLNSHSEIIAKAIAASTGQHSETK
jgi:hypothetical protein